MMPYRKRHAGMYSLYIQIMRIVINTYSTTTTKLMPTQLTNNATKDYHGHNSYATSHNKTVHCRRTATS